MKPEDMVRMEELREERKEARLWGDSLDEEDAEELRYLEGMAKSDKIEAKMWAAWAKAKRVWRASAPTGEVWYALTEDTLADPYFNAAAVEKLRKKGKVFPVSSPAQLRAEGVVIQEVDRSEVNEELFIDTSYPHYCVAGTFGE